MIGCHRVLRDGKYVEISVKDLVPGDVVVLKPGIIHCDMIVLKSDRILVDESALTGEATPVSKMGVDPSMREANYSQTHHKSFTISAGTEITEMGKSRVALGLVTTTGSFTTKGELLTEVFSYQRHKFKFDDDVMLVIFILALETVVLVTTLFLVVQVNWVYTWFYGKGTMSFI